METCKNCIHNSDSDFCADCLPWDYHCSLFQPIIFEDLESDMPIDEFMGFYNVLPFSFKDVHNDEKKR